MKVICQYTDTGHVCRKCGYTVVRWYTFDDFPYEKLKVTKGNSTNWLCIDCMMDIIINECEVRRIESEQD